jgi:hypothetical protein
MFGPADFVRRKQSRLLVAGAMLLGSAFLAMPAAALPELQLYIEGAAYDGTSETWVLDGASDSIRLWAIGNVAGAGGKGAISHVHLAIAYDGLYAPSFTLTPSTTGGFGGYLDPSVSDSAILEKTVTDGSVPTLSDGSALPSHGEYGAGVSWQQFALGTFSLTDSQIEDFTTLFPTPDLTPDGQINVYDISVADLPSGAWLHFDLYNSVQSGNDAKAKSKSTFAPFSHDALATTLAVPEPATSALLGGGLLAFQVLRRRQRRRG